MTVKSNLPKTKAIVLTDRDREILKFIGQGGLASLGQLHLKFWLPAKERTAQARLGELIRAGYIASQQVHVREAGEQVFTLTRKGAAEFNDLERRSFIIGLPAHHELKQQLVGQDLRLAIEKELAERGLKLTDWQNERQLRSNQRRQEEHTRKAKGWVKAINSEDIPDARAIIQSAEGVSGELDIEIDGQYFGKMLSEKIKSLAKSGRPMLWATSATRVGRIQTELGRIGATNIQVVAVD